MCPMMGDTPLGVVAKRIQPFGVASFGSVTQHPRTPEPCTKRYDGFYYVCLGQRREPQSGFGRVKVLVFSQDRFYSVLWSRSSVVDVPLFYNDEFQQSKRFDLKVPQTQFFLRVLDIPVVTQRQVPTVQTFTLQVQFMEVVDMPAVVQRQVPAVAVC